MYCAVPISASSETAFRRCMRGRCEVCVAVLMMGRVCRDIALCQVINSQGLYGEKKCTPLDCDAGGTRQSKMLVTVYQ